MNYQMVLKKVNATVQPDGSILLRLSLEVAMSRDMAGDLTQEAAGLLDQAVQCTIEGVQPRIRIFNEKQKQNL